MTSTEPIVIPIEANPADFIADAKKVQEQMDILKYRLEKAGVSQAAYNTAVANSSKAMQTQVDAAKRTSISMTDLRSSYMIVADAARIAGQVWQATAGETVELANTVRQFRDVTGQTAEESSRLVQVLDDYKVSVSAAEVATKKLSKDGLEFNIQTLAELSDQYLSLNDKQARTQFLYDTFGKSGADFAEVMLQGSDAILAANDAIDKNLILTDKALQQAREYEQNVDNLTDSMTALKVQIGNELIPVANNMFDIHQREIEAMERLGFEYGDYIGQTGMAALELEKEKIRLEQVSAARWNGLASLYEEKTAKDDLLESTEDLSAANESYLRAIGSVTKEIDGYKEKESDLKEQHADLLEEKQKLLDQGWWAESDAVQAINDKLAENEQAQADNAAAVDKATKTRILSMLEQQLAVDGLDARESEFLINQGVEWGIYSEDAIAAMAAAQAKVDELIGKYGEVPTSINTTFTATFATAGYEGQGGGFSYATGDTQYQQPRRGNTSGGSYMIPMTWGNEGLPIGNSDTASGGELISITPKGQNPNAEVVAAIERNRIDYDQLTRAFVTAVQQVSK